VDKGQRKHQQRDFAVGLQSGYGWFFGLTTQESWGRSIVPDRAEDPPEIQEKTVNYRPHFYSHFDIVYCMKRHVICDHFIMYFMAKVKLCEIC